MTRFFNKFGRLAAVVVLAGVAVPQVAMADGKHGGNGGSGRSSNFMKSSGNQFSIKPMNSQPMSVKRLGSSMGNFQQSTGNSMPMVQKFNNSKITSGISSQSLSTRQIKTLPLTVGKYNPNLIKSRTSNVLIAGGKLNGAVTGKIKTLPGTFPGKGPLVDKIDPGFTPFPGGKPPKVKPPFDPFPGGKPPKMDPGQSGGGNGGGGGNGNGGGCGPGNGGGKYCKSKCPWPIFWPCYNGNYWNNSCYYGPGYNTPIYVNSPPVVINEVVPVSAQLPTSATNYGMASVDLVLEDVQLIEPATLLVGPAYRVKFRNQGLTAAGKFRVAIVAGLDGQASEQSPKTLVDVPGLASSEASEVTVRLPVSAMKLAGAGGQATVFTHLLVAADFDNGLTESDKTNNVAVIERTMLEVPTAK